MKKKKNCPFEINIILAEVLLFNYIIILTVQKTYTMNFFELSFAKSQLINQII